MTKPSCSDKFESKNLQKKISLMCKNGFKFLFEELVMIHPKKQRVISESWLKSQGMNDLEQFCQLPQEVDWSFYFVGTPRPEVKESLLGLVRAFQKKKRAGKLIYNRAV